jgi:Kef-type K+ transport system membrane component KefB
LTPTELNARLLLAVTVVIITSRLAGWAIARVGQPRVHGEILAGLLLGPSLVGAIWVEASHYLFPAPVVSGLEVLAQLGLVLFMFLIGAELDFGRLRGQGHKAVLISHTSIIAPTVLGVGFALAVHGSLAPEVDRLGFALFCGAAMAITAFPVLARVLQETGLSNTRIGTLTITCAAVDDVTAWCLLAVVVAVANASGLGQAGWAVVLSLSFLALMVFVVRPILARVPHLPVWLAVALALAAAWTTERIGVHAIFGGFLMGAVIPRRDGMNEEVSRAIEPAVLAFLLPTFFVVVGLDTRVGLLDSWGLWGVVVLVIILATAGKLVGSMLAARVVGESWRDATTIGILMNTRGLTELVILSVGLELGLLTPTVFTIMVIMALATTLMATPLLRLVGHGHGRPRPGRPDRPLGGDAAHVGALTAASSPGAWEGSSPNAGSGTPDAPGWRS